MLAILDYDRIISDINREFGPPFLDEESVNASLVGPNRMRLKIGRRTVDFSGRTFRLAATGTDGHESSVYPDFETSVYEVAIQKQHLKDIRDQIDRLLELERVKKAENKTWYRFTVSQREEQK